VLAAHALQPAPVPHMVPVQDGQAPLHVAAWHGHLAVVDELLSHGASLSLLNKVMFFVSAY